MLTRAKEIQEDIINWRRTIHQNPELSFQEFKTAELISEALQEMGIKVQNGIAKTGVVGVLGEGKPAIGIRADMDALPLQEENQVPYASQNEKVMHACGHDSHVAILLGAAKLLSSMPNRPEGEIRFLFQPSEEAWDADGYSGGMLMVEEGALDGLDAVFGTHVDSMSEAGKVLIGGGYVTAAVDSFEAEIRGIGCHGAYPHGGIDPTFALAQVINSIHGIRARRIDPLESAVISIGSIHAGAVHNIIPEVVKVQGTMRSYDENVRQQLIDELKKAFAVSHALGCQSEVKILKGYPSTYNDPEIADIIKETAQDLFGEEALAYQKPGMGAEDFAYMAQKTRGAMFSLGVKIGDRPRPHHSPFFDIDESALPIGSALMAETAVRLLKQLN